MTIRRARADELETCRELERRAGEVFRGTAYSEVADAEPNDIEIVRAAHADGLLWVAAAGNDDPVGHLTAAEGPNGLLIAQIDVLPAYQGRGFGRALIAAAEEEARRRGLPFIWLRTFRDIPWNAPFYAKLGFSEVEGGLFGVDDADVVHHEVESGLNPAARVTMRKKLA